MSIIAMSHKRTFKVSIILAVFGVIFCLLFPVIQFLVNYSVRFLQGQHPFDGYAIHSAAHESLPAVVVEPGRTLCCHTEFCDFRFPLPDKIGVVATDSVSGGFDTIRGAIYVTNISGGQVDLRSYGRLLHKAGFRVSDTAGTGEIFAGSPDGGALEIHGGQTTKISFSFFGDY